MKQIVKYIFILLFFVGAGCSLTKNSLQEAGPDNIEIPTEDAIGQTVSASSEKERQPISHKSENSETAVVESMIGEAEPFDVLLSEAKIYYTNALLAQTDEDSVEVELQLSLALDVLADIELYNNLDDIQYEEFTRFTDLIATQFKDYAPQTKNIHEKLSAVELRDFIDNITEEYFSGYGTNGYKVIDDRDGHIPIIINKRVNKAIEKFKTQRRGDMQTWLRRKAQYERLMREILMEYNIPEELVYLSMIESEFKTDALSYMGAMGLWQFMITTGKAFGLKYDYWVDERRDPEKSTIAAAKYFRYLYDHFNDWYLVMAAYNAGEGRVRRSIKYEHTRDYWKMKTLPRATRNYVPHVLAAAAISIKPEKYGFRSFKPRPVWDYDTLTINGSYELEKIARVCGVKFSTVMELNPELRKMRTPAYEYTIRLPKGKRPLLEQELKNIEKASESRLYVVKAGDNLSKISQRFSVNIEDIMIVNQLRSKERIYVGQKLQIPSNGTAYLSSGSMHKKDPSKPDLSTTHRKIEYIVKRGDTLGEIAEIYDTRASRIRLWNGLVYGEHIYPEQMLNIWIPKNAAYDMEEYVTVRPGDSLYIIANQRGMTLNELKRLNPNLNYSKIFPGDKIRVR